MSKKLFEHINKLRVVDPKVAVTFDSGNTAVTLLRGKLSKPINVENLRKTPFAYARRFIARNKVLLGEVDEKKQLQDEATIVDARGNVHVTLGQKVGRIPVYGARLSVHYNAEGVVYLLKSNLASKLKAIEAKVTSEKSQEVSKKHAGRGADTPKGHKPQLLFVDSRSLRLSDDREPYYLCWRLPVVMPEGHKTPGWIYFIDAKSGKVLFRHSDVRTGTGTGFYSSGAALNSEASGGAFRLRDDVTTGGWAEATKPVIHTYDDAGSSSCTLTNYSEDSDDVWNNGGAIPASRSDDQRPEVDLHRYLQYVLDYYYLSLGYNGWNGAGSDVKGHAHNELLANNAYWWGLYEQVYFADGNGTTRDFMCPLDTVAHEYTHGVKYYFNILQTYDGETGALDEATSDLIGAMVALDHPGEDPWPWHHGRQYRLDGTVGRNMIDPSRDAVGTVQYDATNNTTKYNSALNGFYPDHYSIRYTGTSDYHGVHINCPIVTHAVYLMVMGGTHRLSGVAVTGIGAAPVEQMLWQVLSTGVLGNSTDFAEFRVSFIEACLSLYPENLDYLATVKNAFYAVGIGPDLYIRDLLTDQGDEPGTLSCSSPDIIIRKSMANAATLTQIGDITNGSLGEEISLTGGDHYVYFRIHNRGASSASGTFRLFISPVSTFPTPATWHEVGHYDFPSVVAGGLWVPTAAAECITLTSALITTLGTGHFCLIGIIESNDDPQPDHNYISSISEFHDFISKSNNYAWRNTNITTVTPDTTGELAAVIGELNINGFGNRDLGRVFEIDTRDLPDGTEFAVWLPVDKMRGLKAKWLETEFAGLRPIKIGAAIELPLNHVMNKRPMALGELTAEIGADAPNPAAFKVRKTERLRPFGIRSGKVIQLHGMHLTDKEKVTMRFTMKFPNEAGPQDVTVAFRERIGDERIGQVNFVYRIRKRKR